ncbi:MAG: hypothetical protein WCV72_04160 [Patescibacteria group bacterium]
MLKKATIEKEASGEDQIPENITITIQAAEQQLAEIKRKIEAKELSFPNLSELAHSLNSKINQELKRIHADSQQGEPNNVLLVLSGIQKDLAKLVARESTMKLLKNKKFFRTMAKIVLTLNLEGKKGKS